MSAPEIYDDLKNSDLGEKVTQLQLRNDQLVKHIQSLENDIVKLCKELTQMKVNEDNLKKNISELFNTAKVEVERKDRMIADLRMKLDDLIFRRKINSRNRVEDKPQLVHDSVKRIREEAATETAANKKRKNEPDISDIKSEASTSLTLKESSPTASRKGHSSSRSTSKSPSGHERSRNIRSKFDVYTRKDYRSNPRDQHRYRNKSRDRRQSNREYNGSRSKERNRNRSRRSRSVEYIRNRSRECPQSRGVNRSTISTWKEKIRNRLEFKAETASTGVGNGHIDTKAMKNKDTSMDQETLVPELELPLKLETARRMSNENCNVKIEDKWKDMHAVKFEHKPHIKSEVLEYKIKAEVNKSFVDNKQNVDSVNEFTNGIETNIRGVSASLGPIPKTDSACISYKNGNELKPLNLITPHVKAEVSTSEIPKVNSAKSCRVHENNKNLMHINGESIENDSKPMNLVMMEIKKEINTSISNIPVINSTAIAEVKIGKSLIKNENFGMTHFNSQVYSNNLRSNVKTEVTPEMEQPLVKEESLCNVQVSVTKRENINARRRRRCVITILN